MDRMMAMETFATVVDAGSFSAAARRLKLGQPAVSKSIAQLEEHLGARLLLRSTRGLTPTDAGQRFYETPAVRSMKQIRPNRQCGNRRTASPDACGSVQPSRSRDCMFCPRSRLSSTGIRN